MWREAHPRPCSSSCASSPPVVQSANALSFDELQGLTYLQVKGSGLANTCPTLSGGSASVKDLKAGTYKMEKFCMEPTSFTVKEESQVGRVRILRNRRAPGGRASGRIRCDLRVCDARSSVCSAVRGTPEDERGNWHGAAERATLTDNPLPVPSVPAVQGRRL